MGPKGDIAENVFQKVWAPGGPPQAAARAGALLLININAPPYHAGKWRQREEMLRTRARDYAATIAYVNLVGGQDELVFDGMSLVVDHLGTVVARGPQFQEGLVYCDVDLEAVQQARRANGVPAAGAPLDEEIATPTIPVAARRRRRRDAITPTLVPPLEPLEEIYQALVLGTRDSADGALQQIRLARPHDREQERDERGVRHALRRHGRRLRRDQGRAEDARLSTGALAQPAGRGLPGGTTHARADRGTADGTNRPGHPAALRDPGSHPGTVRGAGPPAGADRGARF